MASRTLRDPTAKKIPGEVQPADIYYGTYKDKQPVKLRIATGGAGQSGLVKALADAFIDDRVNETKCPPFAVSWIKSDTAASFNHLADSTADLSITYHGAAEEIAIAQGIADKRVYAWRDHFMLVGMHTDLLYIREIGISLATLQVRRRTLQSSPFAQTLLLKRSSLNCSLLLLRLTIRCASSPDLTSRPPISKNPPSGRRLGRRRGRILFPFSTTSTRSSRTRHWRLRRGCRNTPW